MTLHRVQQLSSALITFPHYHLYFLIRKRKHFETPLTVTRKIKCTEIAKGPFDASYPGTQTATRGRAGNGEGK